MYVDQGQWLKGDKHLDVSLNLAREVGDSQRCAEALAMLGQSAFKQGKLTEAAETYLPNALALAREMGDKATMALALMWLGAVAALRQKSRRADIDLRQALVLAREAELQSLEGRILNILGENTRLQGKDAEAVALYQEALSVYRAVDNQFGITLVTHNLGHLAAASGDGKTALRHYHDALRLALEIQAIPPGLETLAGLAGLKITGGEPERALEWLGLVLHHPACPEEARRLFAAPFLAQLRAILPPEMIEAGLERGRPLDFETLAKEVLAET
jgi:tetratricopeptide (TPR) repeat protein